MRAKLKIISILQREGHEILTLQAVGKSEGYPEDGSDENNTYATWTPTASLEITITNPALRGKFTPGQAYYVDFTPADK